MRSIACWMCRIRGSSLGKSLGKTSPNFAKSGSASREVGGGQLWAEHLELELNRRECLQASLGYSSKRPILKPPSIQHEVVVGDELRVEWCRELM